MFVCEVFENVNVSFINVVCLSPLAFGKNKVFIRGLSAGTLEFSMKISKYSKSNSEKET